MARRWLILALLLLLVIVAALGGYAVAQRLARAPAAPIYLQDGSEWVLLDTTYGTNHVFHAGGLPMQILARLSAYLPKQWRPPGPAMLTQTWTNDMLCAWFRERRLTNAVSRRFPKVVVTDAVRSGIAPGTGPLQTTLPNGDIIHGYAFKALPRRSREFHLALADYDHQYRKKVYQEYTIPNPRPWRSTSPEWEEPLMPATTNVQGLDFTFHRLIVGVGNSGFYRETNFVEARVFAEFQIQRDGVTLTNWRVERLEATDVTGNFAVNSRWSQSYKNGKLGVRYQYGLWPDEPAWRMRIEFSRTGEFHPDELWTVRDVPLDDLLPSNSVRTSGSNRTSPVAATNVLGATLELFPLEQQTGYSEARITVHITHPQDGHRLTLVSVVDEQGRSIQRSGGGWTAEESTWDLRELKDAKSLDITVAYHPSVFVDFMVKPTAAPEAGPGD